MRLTGEVRRELNMRAPQKVDSIYKVGLDKKGANIGLEGSQVWISQLNDQRGGLTR